MTEQDKKDIKEVLDLLANCLEAEEIDYVPISTDWLAEHDKKIRADAIAEYKSKLRKQFLNYDEHGCPCLSDIMEILDDVEIELKEQKK